MENYETVQPIHINSEIVNDWDLSTRVRNKVSNSASLFLEYMTENYKFSDTIIFKYSYWATTGGIKENIEDTKSVRNI